MTDALLRRHSCGWYDYRLCFHENIASTEKKGCKNWGPKFQAFKKSYQNSSVVQTASNWNLQKLLKSEL